MGNVLFTRLISFIPLAIYQSNNEDSSAGCYDSGLCTGTAFFVLPLGFGVIIDIIWSGFLWNSFKNFVNPSVLSQEEIFENMDTNGDGQKSKYFENI
jgi:hypothetical protein